MNKQNYTKMRGAYVLMLFLFITHMFSGFSSAPPLGRTGAPGDGACTDCHGGNNPQGLIGSVQILGLPAEVTPNTTYRVTVEVASLNGLSQRAGMQMVALKSDNTAAGTFSNPSNGGSVTVNSSGRNYLGHSPAQGYDANGISSWEVDWTTPADTDPNVTFYAVGNVTDMDNGSNTANDLVIFETENTEIIDPVMELPDLFASDVVGFGGTFAPDDVVEFTWDLNNNSNVVATESYRIAMFLSDDTQFSADDPLVGEVPTGNTFPGVIPSVPGAIRIPQDAADGDYYLHFLVDADGVIEESDEDNNLLTTSTTITVETPQVEPLNIDVSTEFNCDGTVMLTAVPTGGIAPYTYLWNNTGETTQSILIDEDEIVVLTLTDNSDQELMIQLPIEVLDVLSAQVVINELPACGALGSVSIIATGGVEPYQFIWSDGASGADRDDLVGGTITTTVTDANGCFAVLDVVLDSNSDITLDATITQLTCPDANDAMISVVASGGSGNYTYAWSNQATTASISGLPGGTYTVTVDDGGACQEVQSFVITMLQSIELISTVSEITCDGDSDGAISVLAIGGTGPYQYIWSNNVTTNNNINLTPGSYTVTVVDANNCLFTEEFEIAEVPALVPEVIFTNVTCFGAADGSFIAQIVGDDTSIQSMDNLVAGVYTVTLTNAAGCSLIENISILEPDELNVIGEVDDVLCFGEANGAINITQVVGGVPPYSFAWSNGINSMSIVGVVAGSYEVTVTDAQACTVVRTFVVDEPTELSIAGETTLELDDNSAIAVQVTGGVMPYTYLWNTGQTTPEILNLPEGFYEVTVTDDNGCTLTESFNIIFTSVQTIAEVASLSLYPTPTQDLLNVEVSFSDAVDISTQVFSLDGAYQEFLQADFSSRAGVQTSQIDVSDLEAGIYMLVLKSELGIVAKRFVKL